MICFNDGKISTGHLTSLFLATVLLTMTSAEVKNTTIELVQLLFRHGDRSPASTYPNDPHQEDQWTPYGWGNLTDVGARQAFKLGRYLSDQYRELDLKTIGNDEVYVRSTAYLRTQMTANCVMAGLTFPDNITTFDPWTQTQPFPVHFQPMEKDQLFGTSSCKTFEMLEKKWRASSEEYNDYVKKNKDLFKELSQHAGMAVNEQTIGTIADAVFCETQHNMSQPPWMLKYVPQLVKMYRTMDNYAMTKDAQRLSSGPLLENMITNIYAKVHEKDDAKKLMIYSAHDITVGRFLSLLDIFNDILPPYTACVMVELHRQDRVSFIKILYRNDTTKDPYTLQIPGCEKLCPLAQFLTLVKNVTLREENRSAECGPVWGSVNPGENVIPLTIAGVLVLFVVIGGIAFILKRRGSRNEKPMNYRQLLQDSESNLLDSDDDDELL